MAASLPYSLAARSTISACNSCSTLFSNSRPHPRRGRRMAAPFLDRKSTRLNSSHSQISYALFCLKTKVLLASHAPASLETPVTDDGATIAEILPHAALPLLEDEAQQRILRTHVLSLLYKLTDQER